MERSECFRFILLLELMGPEGLDVGNGEQERERCLAGTTVLPVWKWCAWYLRCGCKDTVDVCEAVLSGTIPSAIPYRAPFRAQQGCEVGSLMMHV